MRFLVYSHHNDNTHEGATFREVGELTARSKLAYAKRHGYDFLCQTTFPAGVAPCFERIYMALENLSQYDWMLYTDADASIVNHAIKLEDLIDDRYDLITTQNGRNTWEVEINNGVMLIRCTDWIRDLFKQVDQPQYHSHPWLSQKALMDLVKDPAVAARIKLTPWRFFNSLWHSAFPADNWQHGDFIIHACGGSNAWRKALFTELDTKNLDQPFTINTPPCR